MHFGVLFSLRCDHGYYESGRCTDVFFEPTEECRERLARFRLLFKQAPVAAVVAEKKDIGTPTNPNLVSRVPIPDGTVFRFALRLRDSRFFHVSDIEPSKLSSGTAYVFTTKGKSVTPVGGEPLIRVQTGSLPDPVPVEPKRFIRDIDPALGLSTLDLVDAENFIQLERPIVLEPGAAGAPLRVPIDARGVDDGLYTLSFMDAGGNVISSEELFLSDDARPRPVAFVEVHFDGTAIGQHPAPIVSARIQARKVTWVYEVLVRPAPGATPGHAVSVNGLSLQSDQRSTLFSKTVAPPGNPEKAIFTSNAPIALKERPRTDIQLQHTWPPARNGTPVTATIVESMPNPATDRLSLAGGQFESRMFLTVN